MNVKSTLAISLKYPVNIVYRKPPADVTPLGEYTSAPRKVLIGTVNVEDSTPESLAFVVTHSSDNEGNIFALKLPLTFMLPPENIISIQVLTEEA